MIFLNVSKLLMTLYYEITKLKDILTQSCSLIPPLQHQLSLSLHPPQHGLEPRIPAPARLSVLHTRSHLTPSTPTISSTSLSHMLELTTFVSNFYVLEEKERKFVRLYIPYGDQQKRILLVNS